MYSCGSSAAGRAGRYSRFIGDLRLFGPAVFTILLTSFATLAAAQERPRPPNWAGDLSSLGANVLINGLSAGVVQKVRGGSFQDGFTRGSMGGAVVYGGKRIAVQGFAGAGLLGREVAAVGTSISRNAADGLPSLSRLMLPVGPVRLYLHLEDGVRVQARADLTSVGATVYGIIAPELRWDAATSLSAGAPVFRAKNLLLRGHGDAEGGATGITRTGVIYLSDIIGVDFEQERSHEQVHVLQFDQVFWLWTSPAEQWALRRLPGGSMIADVVDPNLSQLFVQGLGAIAFKNYLNRPWEVEARFLSER